MTRNHIILLILVVIIILGGIQYTLQQQTLNYIEQKQQVQSGQKKHTPSTEEEEEEEQKKESREPQQIIYEKIGVVSIPTPFYELTGKVLEGTKRVDIKRENNDQESSYTLTKFREGDKEFLTRMRLDLGNIDKGDNLYTITFYGDKEAKEIIGGSEFLLDTTYDSIKIGNDTIYFDKSQYHGIRILGEGESNNSTVYVQPFANTPLDGERKGYGYNNGILVKNNSNYKIITNPIIVNQEQNWVFEIKNPRTSNTTPSHIGDYHTVEGELIVSGIPYMGFGAGGEYGIGINYMPQKNYLHFPIGDGDACRWFREDHFVDLALNEEVFSVRQENHTVSIKSGQHKRVVETISENNNEQSTAKVKNVSMKYFTKTATQDYTLMNETILYSINKNVSIYLDGCPEPVNPFTVNIDYENNHFTIDDEHASTKREISNLFNPKVTLK